MLRLRICLVKQSFWAVLTFSAKPRCRGESAGGRLPEGQNFWNGAAEGD
jgi:hypothetical protein